MIKFYIIARWMFFMFIIAPILFYAPMVAIASIFNNKDMLEVVTYIGLPLIYVYLIKKLLKDTYNKDNLPNLSPKFKTYMGLIYAGYFISVATVIAVMQINVLAFFAGLPLIVAIIMLIVGAMSARSELLIKEVILAKPYQIGNLEMSYVLVTVISWILASLVG